MREKLKKGALSHYSISEIKEWLRMGKDVGHSEYLTYKKGDLMCFLCFGTPKYPSTEINTLTRAYNPVIDYPCWSRGSDKPSVRMEMIDLSKGK